jgi:hypothetical protein
MFAVFTRLTRDEGFPWMEQLEARTQWLRLKRTARRLRGVAFAPARPRRLTRIRVLLLLIPLALVGLMIGLISVGTPNPRAACWAHQAHLLRGANQARTCLAGVGLRGSEVWLGPARAHTAA